VQTGCAEDLLRVFFDSLTWRPIKPPAYLNLLTPAIDAPCVFLAQTAIFRQLSTHSLRAESLCQSYIRGLLGKMNADGRHRLEALRLFFFLLTNSYEPMALNSVGIRAFTNEDIPAYLNSLPIDRPEVRLFIDMTCSILSDAAVGQLSQELVDKIWAHAKVISCQGPDAAYQKETHFGGSSTGFKNPEQFAPRMSARDTAKAPDFDPSLYYEEVNDSYVAIAPTAGRIVGLRNTNNTCYIASLLQGLYHTCAFLSCLFSYKMPEFPPTEKDAQFQHYSCGQPVLEALKNIYTRMLFDSEPHLEYEKNVFTLIVILVVIACKST
jgi:hypothetical protein